MFGALCGKIDVNVRVGYKIIENTGWTFDFKIMYIKPLPSGLPLPLEFKMKTKKYIFISIYYTVFFASIGLLIHSEQYSYDKLLVDNKPPYREEVNLSEFDFSFDLPALSNNKDPVPQSINIHKYSLVLNSSYYCFYDYKRYFFNFSSYLRNKHFFLGEHSSLRAPPVIT